MGTITKPYTFSPGGVIYSAEINSVLDTLYECVNGNLDNANIKSAAGVESSKIDFGGTNPFLPSGIIAPYGGTSAPTGWLLCDGTAVSRSTYTVLFAAIGTSYGVGDGSTTFNLPDFRERSPMGLKSGSSYVATLGATSGAFTHKLTVDEMPAHTHANASNSFNYAAEAGGNIGTGPANTGSTGGDQAHNNLHPVLGVNYIIKI